MADRADVFAERLLQIVDEGRRTATYKLALLLALMDACAAGSDETGSSPTELHTRTIARYVLNRYLSQAHPYPTGDEVIALRQISAPRSAALAAVAVLRELADEGHLRTASQIVRQLPKEYERCLDVVEYTFARYPVRLLQNVGSQSQPFLYDVDWTDSVSLRSLHADGGGLVRFRPGAGDHLVRLAPLVRPLIEVHWTRMVARINTIDVESERLRAHLFGTARAPFPAGLRSGLADLQDNRCFYCGQPLGRRSQVDHFIPWSRWPNDAIENLVLADRCNSYKSDYLPAHVHIDSWSERLVSRHGDLRLLADRSGWASDHDRTIGLARSCYAQLPAGTPLWRGRDDFTIEDPAAVAGTLATIPSRGGDRG